jgi:DNA mismatch repair protein MutL
MRPRIQQLSMAVANQIAAGEVIERPASVVKELLENALDANADTINIEIGFGGLNQIKISDNGIGIIADDLPLAIAAHATSKIKQLNDLYSISSMGFRGEALASIASVSTLSLSSKPDEQEHATMLRFSNGILNLSPCARTRGTTVDVCDLFFNAPIRKKFLKSARSEYQAIEMVVKRFALSASNIAITLKHDDKQQLMLPAATCEKTQLVRLRKLLGKDFIEQAIYLDVEQDGMRLHGWVSGPRYGRSQNDKQWLYVNQRMVKDKLINHAFKQAYDGLLHPGRHSACVLYFTIAAELVDINVHPTKHEVRFQQPRLVHDFIVSNLSQALMRTEQKVISVLDEIKQHSEVREAYVKQPLRAMTQIQDSASNHWVVLNHQFVLIMVSGQPYIVDIAEAQQYRLLAMLRQQTYPLLSRPLLVPVRRTIEAIHLQLLKQYQPVLAEFGIHFDWIDSTTIIIRTLPTCLPQLNINDFFQHLKTHVLTQPDILKLLVVCHAFDVQQLSLDDKTALKAYLQQQIQHQAVKLSWCMNLNAEKCRELMYV